ncbi:hypothetical protein ACH5RR_009397 [Cinchona calisaya]|uniref:Uncharacterized protein n=1 Tax=Cinchona calisaya TaxID=153742 RepID=A0ABD3AE20_9GENT
MKLEEKDLKPVTTPLVGFAGEMVIPFGYITLPMMFGTPPRSTQVMVDFIVTKASSPYNAIIGRPTIRALGAIPSFHHMKMKSLQKIEYGRLKEIKQQPSSATSPH